MTSALVARQAIEIAADRERVFDAFVNDINRWWPRQGKYRYSFAPADTEPGEIHFEPHPGGRYYEKFANGRELIIGHITTWDPPVRLSYTWRAPDWDGETLVEIAFKVVDGGTRVEIRHSGWENPGVPDAAIGYGEGHADVLQAFADWVLAQ